MNCVACQGDLELSPGNMYARCTKCFAIYTSLNGVLTRYPLDDSTRPMMEQALGFTPSGGQKLEAPTPRTLPGSRRP